MPRMPDRSYWQVGSGKGDRFYYKECLDYGVACVGEGYWETAVSKVEEGDVVILRKGIEEIVAVGRVCNPGDGSKGLADPKDTGKNWLYHFDGWELPAYCHVEWHEPDEHWPSPKQLAQTAICRVKQSEVQHIADQILDQFPEPYNSRYDGPATTKGVLDEEIADFICEHVDLDSHGGLKGTLKSIRSLADDYYEAVYTFQDEVKEHEIRTFLIVPLLLALGWEERELRIEMSPGKLGVKKNQSIDIACFPGGYRPGNERTNKQNCALIIESKRFSAGMSEKAPEQVTGYAQGLDCEVVVVSNGYCYKAFERDKTTKRFREEPSAYFNLRRPTSRYPLNPERVGGTLDLLRFLLPVLYK